MSTKKGRRRYLNRPAVTLGAIMGNDVALPGTEALRGGAFIGAMLVARQ